MIDIMVIISPYFGGYIGIFAIKKSIIDGNQWWRGINGERYSL